MLAKDTSKRLNGGYVSNTGAHAAAQHTLHQI